MSKEGVSHVANRGRAVWSPPPSGPERRPRDSAVVPASDRVGADLLRAVVPS